MFPYFRRLSSVPEICTRQFLCKDNIVHKGIRCSPYQTLWADTLQLRWQAKQVWAVCIHFSLALAWGLQHSRQAVTSGWGSHTSSCGTRLGKTGKGTTEFSMFTVAILDWLKLGPMIVNLLWLKAFYFNQKRSKRLEKEKNKNKKKSTLLHFQVVCHWGSIYISLSSRWTVCSLPWRKRRGTTALMAVGQVNCTARQGAVC